MPITDTVVPVVMAGGTGSRAGPGTAKQFVLLNGRPLFAYAVDRMIRISDCRKDIPFIVLVLPEPMAGTFQRRYPSYEQLCAEKRLIVTAGGPTRFDSVQNGVGVIAEQCSPASFAIVHDAARPLLQQKDFLSFIDNVARLPEGGLLLAGRWAVDTLLYKDSDRMIRPLDRHRVFHAETPQGYRARDFFDARNRWHRLGPEKAPVTDESSLFLATGKPVLFHELVSWNGKLTHSYDMEIFQALLKDQKDKNADEDRV